MNGPSPKDAALDFLHQMQAGKVDRENWARSSAYSSPTSDCGGGNAAQGPG